MSRKEEERFGKKRKSHFSNFRKSHPEATLTIEAIALTFIIAFGITALLVLTEGPEVHGSESCYYDRSTCSCTELQAIQNGSIDFYVGTMEDCRAFDIGKAKGCGWATPENCDRFFCWC